MNLPLTFAPPDQLCGATWPEVEHFHSGDRVRQVERASIRAFVERHKDSLTGRTLDFGAGKTGTCQIPQPYRDLVTGEYVPLDKGDGMPEGTFDCVLCTQVIQYHESPSMMLELFSQFLKAGGCLVLTYPTNWSETESTDLWRFTKAGMEYVLGLAGFSIGAHELRARVTFGNFSFPLGYGVIAYN